jgi:hypothetical protein
MNEHTPENPYCSDFSCWCHTDDSYHATYTDDQLQLTPDEQTYDIALTLLGDHSYQPEYVR